MVRVRVHTHDGRFRIPRFGFRGLGAGPERPHDPARYEQSGADLDGPLPAIYLVRVHTSGAYQMAKPKKPRPSKKKRPPKEKKRDRKGDE